MADPFEANVVADAALRKMMAMPHTGPRLDAAQIEDLLAREFPQMNRDGRAYTIEAVASMEARIRLHVDDRHLRPGGTVSGPAMFALADICLYVAILAQIGPLTQTVTTNMTLNFMRRPPAEDLVAECRLLKLGRRLAVGEVSIRAASGSDLLAHATGTYAIPRAANGGI